MGFKLKLLDSEFLDAKIEDEGQFFFHAFGLYWLCSFFLPIIFHDNKPKNHFAIGPVLALCSACTGSSPKKKPAEAK